MVNWLMDIECSSFHGDLYNYIIVDSITIITSITVSVMLRLNNKANYQMDYFYIWELIEHWEYGVWALRFKPVASHG